MTKPDDPTHLRGHDLNLFVVFTVLMTERNVSRTAERLHMSQAAVSAALRRLRATYDDPLFVRAPGGMAPTVKALQMHKPILNGLEALNIAIGGRVTFDPLHDQFVIRLGMSDDLEAVLMPELITTVARTNPGSSVFCLQTTRLKLSDLLESGKADLGVSATFAWGSQFRSKTLFESHYACLYDPRMLGHDGSLTREEFLQLPHVMISADGTRGIVDDVLEAQGSSRRRLASTSHFAMTPFLLTRVPSVATMPSYVANTFAAQFGLASCEPPIELPSFSLSAVWHEARDADPQIRWMISTLVAIANRVGVATSGSTLPDPDQKEITG